MLIERRGRFIYFKHYSEDELNKLKSLLLRESKDGSRVVNMLFEKDGEYYTYFGYADYIINRIPTAVLKKAEFEYIDVDEESLKQVGKYTLRNYQVKAAKRCLQKKIGTAVVAVGGGKTLIMASITKYLNKPTLIVVPDSQLVSQIYNRFIETGAFNVKDLGILYGKEKKLGKITVGTFQTIKSYIEKYPTKMSQFEVILMDEAQTTWQSNTGRFIDEFYQDKEYLLGFTGTLYRYDNVEKSLEDFIMLGLTGKPIVNIPIIYLAKRGYLAYPYVYMDTVFAPSAPIQNWNRVYKNYIENFNARNKKIVDWAKYFFDKGLKSIILVNTKSHAKKLFELLPEDMRYKTIIIFGNKEAMIYNFGKLHRVFIDYNDIMNKIENTDEYKLVIATQVFNQGTDIPSLNAIILAFGGRSMVSLFQRMGRVLRKTNTKTKAFIVDFFDDTHNYLRSQSYNRVNLYKKEGIPVVNDKKYFQSLVEEEVKRIKEKEVQNELV
jgi:superfamily II DNA or RNA helicase